MKSTLLAAPVTVALVGLKVYALLLGVTVTLALNPDLLQVPLLDVVTEV